MPIVSLFVNTEALFDGSFFPMSIFNASHFICEGSAFYYGPRAIVINRTEQKFSFIFPVFVM